MTQLVYRTGENVDKAVAHLNIELEERFQWYLDNRLTPQLLSIKDEEGKGVCEETALRS